MHANKTSSRGGAEFVVEAGAMVRERQTIVRLPDPRQMRVTSKINEARIPLVEPGMPVTIEIGAIGNTLKGVVTKVNKYAEPTSFFSSQTKEYKTYIDVVEPPPNLRSGMTAEVKIYVAQMKDVLQIPVQGVLEEKGHFFSLLSKGGMNFETQKVEIGASNDKFLVVDKGLEEGDQLVLNPRQYRELMDIPDSPDPPADLPEGKAFGGKKDKKDGDKGGPPVAGGPANAGGGGRGPGGPGGGPGGPPSAEGMVARIMERADTDGDGKLSSDEVNAMEERGRNMVQGADENGDGDIDRSELTRAAAKRVAQWSASGGGPGRGGPGGGGPGGPGGGRPGGGGGRP